MENIGRVLLSESDEEKWQARHKQLSATTNLVGLFRGWVPQDFESSKHRVLYVGKATSNSYSHDEPERFYFNRAGRFWVFARQIADALSCDSQKLTCVAWSNISKLSRPQVKADSSLIVGFEDAAAESIEDEILQIRPTVVVFAAAHFVTGLCG